MDFALTTFLFFLSVIIEFFTQLSQKISSDSALLPISFTISVLFLISRNKKLSIRLLKYAFFSKKIWLAPSTRIDLYTIALTTLIISLFIHASAQVSSFSIYELTTSIVQQLETILGRADKIDNTFIVSIGCTFTIFITFDFCAYWFHRINHKQKYFWKLHSRHHSALILTPLTAYRVHPLLLVFNLTISLLITIIISAISIYISNSSLTEMTVFGNNLFTFSLIFLGSQLHHSHMFIRFPDWLSHIVISPAMHQIHHSYSNKHMNKNYGISLAIWDWMFGTLYIPTSEEKILFGIGKASKRHLKFSKFLLGN